MEKTCTRCGSSVVFHDTAQGRLDAVVAMLERRESLTLDMAERHPESIAIKGQVVEASLALAAARRIARG